MPTHHDSQLLPRKTLLWLTAIIFLSGGTARGSLFSTMASIWAMERSSTSPTGLEVSRVPAEISPTSRSAGRPSKRSLDRDSIRSTL